MRIILQIVFALILIAQCWSFSFQEDGNRRKIEEEIREDFSDVEENKQAKR